jgi:hypothetical protein
MVKGVNYAGFAKDYPKRRLSTKSLNTPFTMSTSKIPFAYKEKYPGAYYLLKNSGLAASSTLYFYSVDSDVAVNWQVTKQPVLPLRNTAETEQFLEKTRCSETAYTKYLIAIQASGRGRSPIYRIAIPKSNSRKLVIYMDKSGGKDRYAQINCTKI